MLAPAQAAAQLLFASKPLTLLSRSTHAQNRGNLNREYRITLTGRPNESCKASVEVPLICNILGSRLQK
jgi:hypothetical protein